MATTRKEKEGILSEITDDLKKAKGIVFSEYRGLTVKELGAVRKALRKENIKYQVVKVTLLKKALSALGISFEGLTYNGPVAVAISYDEETSPARILKGLTKDNQKLVIDGGVFNNALVGSAVVMQLASLPSKDQLRGQLVSVIAGPARGLVTVLSGNMRKLVYALNAIADAKK
ncbi:MAG: 50S ribosomal protein L10 [Candidatus Saccharibacteria bacterium]